MSYRINILLSHNDGDWRSRSATSFKCKSTLLFNDFALQCAQKLYPKQTITKSTPIKLYDIGRGLIPIDDPDNPQLSELHEEDEIYRNCQILVVLPMIHKTIQNPSERQKRELQQEKELISSLPSTASNTPSISSHSIYASSLGYPASIHSMQRPFQNLSSLTNIATPNALPADNVCTYFVATHEYI